MCQVLVNRPVQDLLSNSQQPWEADITIPILQRGKLKPRCARAPKLGHFPNHSMSVLLVSAPSIPAPEYQLAVRPWDCPFPSLLFPVSPPMKWVLSIPKCSSRQAEWGLKGELPVSVTLFQNQPFRTFGAVKVKISSNWGNPRFTCLYRVRVHGSVTPPRDQPN